MKEKFKIGDYFFDQYDDKTIFYIGKIVEIERWETALGPQRIYHYKYIYRSKQHKNYFDWIVWDEDSFAHDSPTYKEGFISGLDNLKRRIFLEIL